MRTRLHPTRGTGAARARRAANGSVVDAGARWGLVARGTIYLLIGVLALRIATGGGGSREADSSGAVQELARQPFGEALVWAIGIGLVGMAVWRLSEAVFGASGPDGRKASKRALNAGRCVFYGFVAFSVLTFVTSSKNSEGSDATSRDLVSRALELPLGRWLVGLAGLVVLGVGVGIGVRAARRTFHKHLMKARMSRRVQRVVDVLGVTGGAARGLVYAAAGVFAVIAAVDYDPGKAKGLDGTLRAFAGTPAGPWLLALVALGLAVFGLFSIALARYRRV
ncbi:DUF1206 domain-containing protein [Streptomyces sp.]|uniref:DUF1206 domain-containing protein n=1 Tax=Streptomyces sp. TaxID=1931 RepID=UPI002D642D5D|nr:DUF1206 domain-containing protein [Streptomyces sp.]HZF92910.1 DUF1206 domain-containing protein [Streptomyces sp.]